VERIFPREAYGKEGCARIVREVDDRRYQEMSLLPWLRKARSKFAGSREVGVRFPLDAHEFHRQATRERMRADRSNSHLAILIIELPADRRTSRDYAFLSNVLSQRLRITDTAGELRAGRVAVLFPDTQKDGAWKVASDICDRYPTGHERPSCEVFLYPDETVLFNDSESLARQPVESHDNRLESLFALDMHLEGEVSQQRDIYRRDSNGSAVGPPAQVATRYATAVGDGFFHSVDERPAVNGLPQYPLP